MDAAVLAKEREALARQEEERQAVKEYARVRALFMRELLGLL